MASSADEGGADSVSMVDILAEEQQREEDANAVLGGSDDKQCTYILGSIPRQALYACATCTAANTQPAGVCLACSLECHEGHELYELYTKRNFRCDCGNTKFGDFKCKLSPDKAALNDNEYNQNFRGLYCTCHRPYPDPQDEDDDDEMIQCVVCEDWYHGRHLNTPVPEGSDYEEMICQQCMEKCSFLGYYSHLQKYGVGGENVKVQKHNDSAETVDVVGESKIQAPVVKNVGGTPAAEASHSGETESQEVKPEHQVMEKNDAHSVSELKKPEGNEDSAASGQVKDSKSLPEAEQETESAPLNGQDHKAKAAVPCEPRMTGDASKGHCRLEALKAVPDQPPSGKTAAFWRAGWRKDLCTCNKCKELYLERDVSYICDVSDTITQYEEHGRAKHASASNQYERGLEALAGMDRVQQVEMLHGFNDMKTELKDYLKRFAENGKVVREEDIREFFSEMSGRKRQRVDMGYFCK